MKRAGPFVLVLLLAAAGVVAADEFPVSNSRPLPSGIGWRVAYQQYPARSDVAFRVGIAVDQATYEALWADDLGAPSRLLPPVDFTSHVVVLFATGAGSCTTGFSFRAVVFDQERRLVHADITERRRCGLLDLTGAAVFVVAMARDRLPARPFELQLGRDRLCAGCPDGMTVDF